MDALSDTTRRAGERAGADARLPSGLDDVLIAREPIVGMLQHDVERVLSELLGARAPNQSVELPPAHWLAGGVRHSLRGTEGHGHWDFYKPWNGLMLSVTDARYRNDTWIRVQGSDYFKLRILLSGTLRSRNGEVLATAPDAFLYVSPGESAEGYSVAGGEPIRMVVLHCRPNLLTEVLGLTLHDIPPPLDALYAPVYGVAHRRITLEPEVIAAARRISESRHDLSRALRDRYLQALSMELLLQALGALERARDVRPDGALRTRETALIGQAREHLSRHYSDPPNIAELARLVGINRTKLKARFREAFGVTIYEFVVQKRMERAAEMLLGGDHDIAQVAYAVGYEYPANFTAAFKRHYGQLPRSWKRPQAWRRSRPEGAQAPALHSRYIEHS